MGYGSRYGSRSVYGSRSGFEGALPSPPFRVSSRSAASGPHMALFVSSCLFTFVSKDVFPFSAKRNTVIPYQYFTPVHAIRGHAASLGATRACPDPPRSPRSTSVDEAHDRIRTPYVYTVRYTGIILILITVQYTSITCDTHLTCDTHELVNQPLVQALRHGPGQRSESNERADIDCHDEPPICSGLQAPWTLAVQVVECLW